MKKITPILLVSFVSISFFCFSQDRRIGADSENSEARKIKWEQPTEVDLQGIGKINLLYFEGASYDLPNRLLPGYAEQIPLNTSPAHSAAKAALSNEVFEDLLESETAAMNAGGKKFNAVVFSEKISVDSKIGYERKVPQLLVNFIPVIKNSSTGKLQKLVSFNLNVYYDETAVSERVAVAPRVYAANSVLGSGNWFKVGVTNDGVYKLDYNFLNNLGVDAAAMNPQNFRLYGNGGGQLAYLNSVFRRDDLTENAIAFVGNADAVFDPSEYFLFYGQSPNRWTYNAAATCNKFKHNVHQYSDTTYYFITADLGAGKRIINQPSFGSAPTTTVTTFDDYAYYENDAVNLIKSGREWLGEKFDIINTYTTSFNFPNIVTTSPVSVVVDLAARADSPGSQYSISSGTASALLNPATISSTCYWCTYATTGNGCLTFTPTSPTISVTITKNTLSPAIGWLNYVEVNARRQLAMNGNQLLFRDAQSVGAGSIAQYDLSNAAPATQVWDVTDPTNVMLQQGTLSGATFTFTLPSDFLKEFVSFNGSQYYVPTAFGSVPNQNLHALNKADFIIVSHPMFAAEAAKLANFHTTKDSMTVVMATPQQIYNEFSSGAQDVSAIRDFVKMFYDKATLPADMPNYLLLFGDGSYDNKRRFSSNTNFIPTYESLDSYTPTSSYVSDDFYALLDDSEGQWSTPEIFDIGVGRFPVKSVEEAKTMVDKVEIYTSVPGTINTSSNSCSNQTCSQLRDWRNWITFIADDEDNGLHLDQAESLAAVVDTKFPNFNIDKIYLDAYLQAATPGGNRYPGVKEAIKKRVEKGALIINYTGHGGEVGIAHERITEVSDINGWENICNMPLFVTATCEFSRWDDPERTSAGEYALLNPNGGGIGLLSTTRLVFASPNFNLNLNFIDTVFRKTNNNYQRLGDIFKATKNASISGSDINNRNFTLLGDPALRLAIPKYTVITDSVNGKPVVMGLPDTLKALSVDTISGEVRDGNNVKLTNFNGIIYVTVFDKPTSVTTLSNEATSPKRTFNLQKNILYKGKVSVTNGDFSFIFVVPKDIAYNYGIGKISYYAHNGYEDASGFYENIVVGGSSSSALSDNVGPDLKLFMNDSKFVSGGITDENPEILATISDANGVNTTGNSIGHDIAAVMDNNTDSPIILNDYYEADLNSYKKGTIRYPLKDLEEGNHSLSLKVWDVYNNSSDARINFVVAKSASLALSHVLNYPNPFTTKTDFYFEHNICCQNLNVQVQIFTVTGKLVKTISADAYVEGFRSEPISWDGKDEYGDVIGRGVYVYRVKVKSSSGEVAEKFEKLVILK